MPATENRLIRTGGRLLLMLLSSLFFVAVFEFVVTTLGLAPPPEDPIQVWNANRDDGLDSPEGEFRFHASWLWEPRPGTVVYGKPINRGGYRGTFYPEERGSPTRIVTLGDSTTYGFGLAEELSWSRFLEKLVRENGGELEVLNFGVIGYTLVQGLELYRGRARDYSPDVVVAAFGAVNDLVPTPPGLTDREKLVLVSSRTYLLRQFLTRYDAFRWLDSLFTSTPDEDVAPEEFHTVPRVSPEAFEATLLELHRSVREDGASLVLVSPPRRRDGDRYLENRGDEYTAIIQRVAEQEGIPLADVHGVFRELERDALGENAADPDVGKGSELFLDRWHPSAKGHRAFAVVVGKMLREAGLLP